MPLTVRVLAALVALLAAVACGSAGSTRAGGPATATTPTTSSSGPSDSSGIPAGWRTYQGDGYVLGYPGDGQWTTKPATGALGEQELDIAGPSVITGVRCFALAVRQTDYTSDLVAAVRATLDVDNPHVLVNRTITMPGATEGIEIEKTVQSTQQVDGHSVLLRSIEVHLLAKDHTAYAFTVIAPDAQFDKCPLRQMVTTFRLSGTTT